MRLTLAKRSEGDIEFGIIYGIIALIAVAAARLLPLTALAPSCRFRAVAGFPCPTCGMTRSLMHLAHGEVIEAVSLNPLFAAVMIIALISLPLSCISVLYRLPRVCVSSSAFERKMLVASAWFLFLSNWVYLVLVF